MIAIILAAGQGVRLRPYTDDRPKCMLEFQGAPLLHYQCRALRSAGVEKIALVAGYHPEAIDRRGLRLFINSRYERTNMVFSLFCARELLDGRDDLLVCYGDIIFEPRVIQALLESTAPVAVAVDLNWRAYWSLRFADPLQDAETLRFGPQGGLVEIGKKPRGLDEIEAQYLGLIRIKAQWVEPLCRLYDAMPREALYDGKNLDNMFMTSLLQYLIDQGWQVAGAPIRGGWLEFDSVEDLNLYNRLCAQGRLAQFFDVEQAWARHS